MASEHREFKEGEEIWLKADAEEGWPRQKAKFIEYEPTPYTDMVMVWVEPEEPDDDGLREISIDQIE